MKDKIRVTISGIREDEFVSHATIQGIKIYTRYGDMYVTPSKIGKLVTSMKASGIDVEITFHLEPYEKTVLQPKDNKRNLYSEHDE